MSFVGELQRRNVFRVALAYIVSAWLFVQVADIVLESIGAPGWVMKALLSLLALGFPPTVLFAWAFEITPEGIKHESEIDRSQSIVNHTGRKLDFMIIALILTVGGYVFWESRVRQAPTNNTTPAAMELAAGETGAASSVARKTEGALSSDKSIAVLPFVNLSSDPEQEFFSDGISEELLNVLAQIPELRVAARTSSFQFKGDNRDISEIAQLLKVNHVLEGSVRKAGTRLRITAQLIEADHGYHLWSQTYDRELEDVFAIQDEISAAIGEALIAQMGLTDDAGLSAPKVAETSNTAAYEAYLKGRYLVNQRGNRAIREAVTELEKSIRLDPNFAPAQAQLAIAIALSNNSASSYGDLTVAEVNARAEPHAKRAMELNPELPEAWGARAIIASANSDYEDAIAFAARALELSPVYTDAINWTQTSALLTGGYQLGHESVEKLMEIDPLSVVGRVNYFSNHLSLLDPDKARAGATELAKQHPWAGYATLSNIEWRQGNISESLRWVLYAYAYDPLDRYSNQSLVLNFCMLNMVTEAHRVSDTTALDAEALCGDLDKAMQLLEREILLDPDDPGLIEDRADLLFWNGQLSEALEIYREVAEGAGGRALVSGGYSLRRHLQLVWLLQQSGNPGAAQVELEKIDRDLAARAGTSLSDYNSINWDRGVRSWLIGDRDTALQYFRKALDEGHRFWMAYDNPMLGSLREDPEFVALRQELDALLDLERTKALQLMCLENPVPKSWQPLAETCADVVEVSSL